MILHCMKKALWEQRKDLERWGEEEIARAGCVHCSSVAFLWRVAPNFRSIDEPLVLLCIDETKLEAEVRYEVGKQTSAQHFSKLLHPLNKWGTD